MAWRSQTTVTVTHRGPTVLMACSYSLDARDITALQIFGSSNAWKQDSKGKVTALHSLSWEVLAPNQSVTCSFIRAILDNWNQTSGTNAPAGLPQSDFCPVFPLSRVLPSKTLLLWKRFLTDIPPAQQEVKRKVFVQYLSQDIASLWVKSLEGTVHCRWFQPQVNVALQWNLRYFFEWKNYRKVKALWNLMC